VLSGFVDGSSDPNDFVQLSGDATHTVVSVDADGPGVGSPVVLATLNDVNSTTTTVDQLITDGNLIVH